jgi:hypothetical protein
MVNPNGKCGECRRFEVPGSASCKFDSGTSKSKAALQSWIF